MGSILDAMRAAGLAPAKEIEILADGEIHRYRVAGDKPGSVNGYFVLHSHPIMAGAFGSWKTGASHTWREQNAKPLTVAEHAEQQRQFKGIQQARAAELASARVNARERAARLWATARPATNAHAYLKRKRIQAYGIRQLRDVLVVPLRDAHGTLHSLQFISADGSKRFLSGGLVEGHYYAIGRPDEAVLLAEGLATGATLHAATGKAVAICFSCGNLLPVARALRDKFPRLRLVICADNDSATPGNPGVTHAKAAAMAVGGFLAVPKATDVAS